MGGLNVIIRFAVAGKGEKKLSTKTAAVQNIQHRICIAAAENPALASGRHNR
jgi:hypothetical protein